MPSVRGYWRPAASVRQPSMMSSSPALRRPSGSSGCRRHRGRPGTGAGATPSLRRTAGADDDGGRRGRLRRDLHLHLVVVSGVAGRLAQLLRGRRRGRRPGRQRSACRRGRVSLVIGGVQTWVGTSTAVAPGRRREGQRRPAGDGEGAVAVEADAHLVLREPARGVEGDGQRRVGHDLCVVAGQHPVVVPVLHAAGSARAASGGRARRRRPRAGGTTATPAAVPRTSRVWPAS